MPLPLRPYPAYKPSGVTWLGDVPGHWEVKRLKSVCHFAYGYSLPSESRMNGDIPIYGSNGIVGRHFVANTLTPCIIIGRKGSFGKVNLVTEPAFAIDTTYFVDERYSSHNLEWLSLLFETLNLDDVTRDSAIPGLNREETYRRLVPLPPLPEQAAIVRYLDHADRRIRRYIDGKERLIALLEEEKQAIINQAVTRGLDPNVRLKPSGVEWLGDVPAHWEIPRLRNLGDASIGLTYDPQDVVDEEDGILVLRASNILDGRLVYGDTVFVRGSVPDKLITQVGDILLCSRSGSRALIGKNACIDLESSGTTFGAFMTVFRGEHNEYLHRVFNSKFFDYQSSAFLTSTINQLTLGILYDMKVPFPPADERKQIIRYLVDATPQVNQTINAARRQIELLREYRTRLISDVVTGKLDVRAAAANLPDESDEENLVFGESFAQAGTHESRSAIFVGLD